MQDGSISTAPGARRSNSWRRRAPATSGAGADAGGGAEVRLADAQLAVARELGEASWPRLVRRVEAGAVAREDRARRLVEEATDGRRDHAEALLALDPDLGREGFDAALVLGDAERVRAALAADPGLATRPTGARDWLPLLYPCHSAFLGGERTDGLVACARALLDAGADPDSSWQHPEFGALGALYGAAGVAHEPRMTALLLEAGANPNDDESVYHATETADDTCLRLLLAAGARVEGRTRSRTPRHRAAGEAAAAARPRARPRGRALAAVGDLPRPLAGGDPHARRPPAPTCNAWDEQNERTPYGLAWRMGRPDLCELLAELGARREIGPVDELIGLCFAGDRDGALRLAAEHPERAERVRTEFVEALHQAAAEGRRVAVELLLDLGVPSTGRGRWAARRCTTRLVGPRRGGRGAARPRRRPAARRAGHRRHAAGLGRARLVPLPRPDRRRRHRPPPDRAAAGAAGAEMEPDMVHAAAPSWPSGSRWRPPSASRRLRRARARGARRRTSARCRAPSGSSREDGFAVRTGVDSNSENGVVCSALDGDPPR